MYYFTKCIHILYDIILYYHTFTEAFLLDYQQINYSADRTDGMEWTSAEDYCNQTYMTDAVLALSSFLLTETPFSLN